MKQTIHFLKDAFFCVGFLTVFFVTFGIAGTMDYRDAVVTEMKNNGRYWELSRERPDLSEAEMVKIYEAEKAANQ